MPSLKGFLKVPGDKSISHRALIFSAFTRGSNRVSNLSPAQDVADTAECLRRLGLQITEPGGGADITINSPGIDELSEPASGLWAGNSGTTIRLMSGLVAGRPFTSRFDGDESLQKRTMKRVLEPLTMMGARCQATKDDYAPFAITGGDLKGRQFHLSVASAQVEACLLLAGLQAEGTTSVTVPQPVRDHTRRMFQHLGIPFRQPDDRTISVERLHMPVVASPLRVPADISSAAFFMVGASLLRGSDITLAEVGTNPGRTLVLDVLREMGAEIEESTTRTNCGEPVTDIRIRCEKRLTGTKIGAERIPLGIDELPVLALTGALCDGELIVSGASDMRHKESDRIAAIVGNLFRAGVEIEEREDGFVVSGKTTIRGGSDWQTFGDHRMAMTGLIASLVFEQPVKLDDEDCMSVSYPGFKNDLRKLIAN